MGFFDSHRPFLISSPPTTAQSLNQEKTAVQTPQEPFYHLVHKICILSTIFYSLYRLIEGFNHFARRWKRPRSATGPMTKFKSRTNTKRKLHCNDLWTESEGRKSYSKVRFSIWKATLPFILKNCTTRTLNAYVLDNCILIGTITWVSSDGIGSPPFARAFCVASIFNSFCVVSRAYTAGKMVVTLIKLIRTSLYVPSKSSL